MDLTLLSSDSDSDLEMLAQLSDSSDEDETLCRPPKRIRRVNYTQSHDDGDFTFRFRLNKHAFNSLLLEITPLFRVTSTRNYGVSPLHQLLLTLRFYALGTMLISECRQILWNCWISSRLGQLMAHISAYSLHSIWSMET
ncbi:unnamed protein product [Parnassius apollo]|uniref:(apollo) hypothetical protein n=1 Tax=Parnassius apollo TaxID=110799 RepID=A0A8S3X6B8_PARAO|nr:unnamed protein product [Parnassius apollo]